MVSTITAWRTVGSWFAVRGKFYLGGIVFISVFMGVLIYLTWGAEPNASMVMCIVAIPVALLVVFALVLLFLRAIMGPPALMTLRNEAQVLNVVERVLEGHGIPGKLSTLQVYVEEHGEEKARELFRHLPSGQDGHVIVVPDGVIVIRQVVGKATYMQPLPPEALPDAVKAEIERGLQ